MKKFIAEFIGTAVLVFFGCGSAVLAGAGNVGQLGISFAFGLAIVAMAYGIGPVSGCHVNPAVSFGAFIARRIAATEMLLYWAAQFLGATVGALLVSVIAQGVDTYQPGEWALGSNGFGPGYLGGYGMHAALAFEIVATFIFLVVILGSGAPKSHPGFSGLAIGLTLVAIHIVGIQVTGVSVNPARSFGPAVLAQGKALEQLWLFLAAPMAGAALAGLVFRFKVLED